MDDRPLPPDLKQRVIERGCAYLSAIGRTLDPPEDCRHFSARSPSEGRPGRTPSGPLPVLQRLKKAASQLFGL